MASKDDSEQNENGESWLQTFRHNPTELGNFRFDPAFFELGKLVEMIKEQRPKEELLKEIENIVKLEHKREEFCDEITAQPSPGLNSIIETTMGTDWKALWKQGKTKDQCIPTMMSGNREVQFIKSMVSMNKSKRALEVGLFTGCGALAIAEALPADGVVVTCEWDPFIVKLTRGLLDKSPHGHKVEIRQGDAMDTCRKLAEDGQQFDFIFIDANKDGYIQTYDIIKTGKLLSPNGTIVVDNVLWHGAAYLDEDSDTARFDQHVLADNDVHRVLLPIRDGVMVIRMKTDVEGSV